MEGNRKAHRLYLDDEFDGGDIISCPEPPTARLHLNLPEILVMATLPTARPHMPQIAFGACHSDVVVLAISIDFR
jgi:hypothetical protein